MILIGIAGRIGAGKDLVAEYLCRHHGFIIQRFSGALKTEVKVRLARTIKAIAILNGHYPLVDETEDQFFDRLLNVVKPMGIRELLQEYGTEVRRVDDPAYWTKAWVGDFIKRDPRQAVVVPDTRFPNEARVIKNQGGQVIRIERPSLGPLSTHSSETSLLDYPYDAVFTNDGTEDELLRQVADWLLRPR